MSNNSFGAAQNLVTDIGKASNLIVVHIYTVVDDIYERIPPTIRIIVIPCNISKHRQRCLERPGHESQTLRSIRFTLLMAKLCGFRDRGEHRTIEHSVLKHCRRIAKNAPIVARHRSILYHVSDLYNSFQPPRTAPIRCRLWFTHAIPLLDDFLLLLTGLSEPKPGRAHYFAPMSSYSIGAQPGLELHCDRITPSFVGILQEDNEIYASREADYNSG